MVASARQHSSLHLTLLLFSLASISTSGMQVGYYAQSCPNAEEIVKETLLGLLLSDATAGAALIRLAFRDCDVQACDASILLDDAPGIESELHSPRNFGIRRLDFIHVIKKALEAKCPGTVSCADIIVLAARDAIATSGGPSIPVLTGRKDSMQAYKSLADSVLLPGTASVDSVLDDFYSKGISLEESVALLGSHTVGVSHCPSFQNRLTPKLDTALNRTLFGLALEVLCGHPSNVTAVPNDNTNLRFDNQYFRDLKNGRGLLTVDANLASDSRSSPIVKQFSTDKKAFFNAYTTGFLKLTQAAVLSDGAGQVRRDCRRIN